MHKVIILPKALDDITKLDKTTAKRILERIEWFSEHIEAIAPIPLKSKLAGFFKCVLETGALSMR